MANIVQRSRLVQVVIASFLLVLFWWFTRGSAENDELSPEEINTIFQNKNKDVEIVKKELFPQQLKSPYLDPTTLQSKHWDIKGNTIVRNNEYVRLTADFPHQVGSVFSKLPIQASSFEMEVDFHLSGKSTNGLMGDGFAVWLTDHALNIGDVFGGENEFVGLGIFIDTYKNGDSGNFPYATVMLGDGKTRYNKMTDGMDTSLDGCTIRGIYNAPTGHSRMRVVYIKDGYLSVDFDNRANGNWKNCVTIDGVADLPVLKHLGFSAETGELSQNVDIFETHVYGLFRDESEPIESVDELEALVNQRQQEETPAQKRGGGRHRFVKKNRENRAHRKRATRLKKAEERLRNKTSGQGRGFFGWIWFLIKSFFLLTVVGVTGWVGFVFYRVQKQKTKKTTGLIG